VTPKKSRGRSRNLATAAVHLARKKKGAGWIDGFANVKKDRAEGRNLGGDRKDQAEAA